VVDRPHSVVAIENEVSFNMTRGTNKGRIFQAPLLRHRKPIIHTIRREVRLSIPTVKRSMISCLSDCVEDQIAFHFVVPPEAIVKVHSCTGSVEAHVVVQRRVRRDGLEEA